MRMLAIFTIVIAISALALKRRIPKVEKKFEIRRFLKNRAFLLLIGSSVFAGYGFLVPFVHIVPFAVDAGISKIQASILLSIMGGRAFLLFNKLII